VFDEDYVERSLFKAKTPSKYTEGAAQVKESRRATTELPIDYYKAEMVQVNIQNTKTTENNVSIAGGVNEHSRQYGPAYEKKCNDRILNHVMVLLPYSAGGIGRLNQACTSHVY
jgi:hypothetical protein